jgi:hypothetical protein
MQPVWNEDGTIAGYIDDPIDEPDFPENQYGNRASRGDVSRSIWDDDVDAPGDDYQYRAPRPRPVNQFRPWAQDGNPWWGAPTPENRDRLRQLRQSDGGPVAPRGSYVNDMSERKKMAAGWLQRTFGTQTKQVRKKGRWLP